jgi:hypothetical protein
MSEIAMIRPVAEMGRRKKVTVCTQAINREKQGRREPGLKEILSFQLTDEENETS